VPPGAPEELALIVKTADRLANVRAARSNNPRLLAVYRSEHPAFRPAAWRPSLAVSLWKELDGLLGDEGCPASATAQAVKAAEVSRKSWSWLVAKRRAGRPRCVFC
jgi:hypothetical protein